MSRADFLQQDAAEMMNILQNSNCIPRYDRISHELLSELLVALATKGTVVGANNRGSDVFSESYGKIEVKSRILGTDGPNPRVSLQKSNLEKADWFCAIRWTREFQLSDAVMLPKSSALSLHGQKKQATGMAHISWVSWITALGAISLKETMGISLAMTK